MKQSLFKVPNTPFFFHAGRNHWQPISDLRRSTWLPLLLQRRGPSPHGQPTPFFFSVCVVIEDRFPLFSFFFLSQAFSHLSGKKGPRRSKQEGFFWSVRKVTFFAFPTEQSFTFTASFSLSFFLVPLPPKKLKTSIAPINESLSSHHGLFSKENLLPQSHRFY